MSNVTKSSLLAGISTDVEVEVNDLKDRQGSSFIDKNGIYTATIEQAILHKTKSKGVCCTLLFRGENSIDIDLYIVSFKNKKLTTTCIMGGKTVSLPDYKLFKQMYAVATGEAKPLEELDVKEDVVKYKKFGKDVKLEGETVVDLIGKTIQLGISLQANYAWNAEDKEVDKTEYSVDRNGDVRLTPNLDSVFNTDGFSAEEIITEATEAKVIVSKKTYLESDKAIYYPKLEEKEVEEEEVVEEIEDDLDF